MEQLSYLGWNWYQKQKPEKAITKLFDAHFSVTALIFENFWLKSFFSQTMMFLMMEILITNNTLIGKPQEFRHKRSSSTLFVVYVLRPLIYAAAKILFCVKLDLTVHVLWCCSYYVKFAITPQLAHIWVCYSIRRRLGQLQKCFSTVFFLVPAS